MLRQRPFHPILFALYPVLALYSLNTALVPLGDVPLPLGLSLLGTCIVWAVLSLVLRSAARGAAGASVGVVLVFLYGHIWHLIQQSPSLTREFPLRASLFPYWCALSVLLVVAACWKWKKPETLTYALNIGGIVLAAFPILSILTSWFSAWRGTAITEISMKDRKLKVTSRPDIYYVILDGYGRHDSLERVIGFNNDWFIKGLEDRGFFVAKGSRSNYCQTELSLSSSLNLDYLPTLLPEVKKDYNFRGVLDTLIDKNQVAKYLKQVGYRYEAITTGFPSVKPSSSDLWMNGEPGTSYFAGALAEMTPMPDDSGVGGSMFVSRRRWILGAIDNLKTVANGGTQPRFIFAHILAPHPPFVFGPDGEARKVVKMGFTYVDGSDFMDFGGTPDQYKKGYTDQATYLSKLVLGAVDEILKRSKTPPIIIIQGDHGSKLKLNQQELSKTDVNECFPNLNAYLVPPSVRANLYDGITPVNSFRMIFDGLFDDKLPKLPDKNYYSGWLTPFDFIDVTDRIKPPATGG